MKEYLNRQVDLTDINVVQAVDDFNLWAAPFGLKLLDTVTYKKNINALDIGFGMGFPIIELAMRLGNSSKVYGIDPWKAGMERTRDKLKVNNVTNVELVEGIAEKMPFADSSFDLLVSNNGINNVQDISKALAECNRVAKKGAQFVFTFNTEESFIEFYDIYREALKECSLKEYNKAIDEHIYIRRKPLAEIKKKVEEAGFKVKGLQSDIFFYRFADALALFNHFTVQCAFIDGWKEIVPEQHRDKVFSLLEEKINAKALKEGCFTMQVPFITMDCERTIS
jgi:arsenite methyltransferase